MTEPSIEARLRAEVDQAIRERDFARELLEALEKEPAAVQLNEQIVANQQLARELAELRSNVVPQVLYDNLKQLRDEARSEVQVLQERIRKALKAGHIADAEDRTDWQRGYRAAAERILFFLSGSDTATNTEEREEPNADRE